MKKKTDYIWVVGILLFIVTLTYRDSLIESITNYCKEHCIDSDKPNCYEDCIEGLEKGMVTIPTLRIKKIIVREYNSTSEVINNEVICKHDQNCNLFDIKKILIDSPIERKYENYKYDLNDNLIKEYNEEGDSIIYSYDSKNIVIKKLRYWGDNPWDRDSLFYSYDSDNNLVKESNFACTFGWSDDNKNGVVDEGEIGIFKTCGSRKGNDFKYDSNGNLIEIYDGYLGGSHFYTQRTILKYNSNNLLIEKLIYLTGRDFIGEQLSKKQVYEYEY